MKEEGESKYLMASQCVKNTGLKLVQVPHLPGLRVSDILKFAKSKVDIEEYLPNFKNDDKFPDRSWV